MSATLDDVLAEVRATRADVARLSARIPQLERLREKRDPRMTLLLPLIFGAVGDRVVTAVDIAVLGTMRGNEELGLALAPMLGGKGGLRGLGRAFAKCAGHDISGFEVRQVGSCRDGSLWQIVRVANSQTLPTDCTGD